MKIITLILIVMLSNLSGKGQSAPSDTFPPSVTKMEYKVRSSWTPFPPVSFTLIREKEGNTYRLTNSSDCREEEAKTIEVPASFAEQIRRIVIEENMLSYERDYYPPYDVLDGSSWSVYIRFENCDKSVYSSGYMAYPDGDGLERLEKLCLDTWKELTSPKE